MQRISSMVDMSITPKEREEGAEPCPDTNQLKYPYGLSISLTHDELEKLNVDYGDWGIGDLFHLHAMAKITSISANETENGENCRVEMQIIALTGEDENEENEEYDEADKR